MWVEVVLFFGVRMLWGLGYIGSCFILGEKSKSLVVYNLSRFWGEERRD